MYWIGLVLASCFFPLTFVLGNTLLAKVCNHETRGTMFGVSGVLGSLSIAILNAIGAEFFKENNNIIFEIAYGNYLVVMVLIIIWAMMGKLNK